MKLIRKTAYISMLFLISLLSVLNQGVAVAITQDDANSVLNNTYFYDPNASQCGGDGSAAFGSGTTTISGAEAWNSNVQPPYYLESFVINVLEDLAQAANVPQTSTVTQEHVVALVAWAWEEGGNITNTDIFNPWNTGLNDPQLLAGAGASNGVQSFKSFNAGVTAATITMTGSYQNRLEKALTDPNTTAEQFMSALTYYQKYPGNQFWAQADQQDQQAYYNELTNVLAQTRSNYNQRASIEIGPGQEGTNNVPTSELKYQGGGNNPTGGGSTVSGSGGCQATLTSSVTCTNGSGTSTSSNAAIACQVMKYDSVSYSQGWHSSGSVFHSSCNSKYPTPTPKGASPPTVEVNAPAENKSYPAGPDCATDCSGLVDLALYDLFGVDISSITFDMLNDANGARVNFKKVSYSQVAAGDLIFPGEYNGDHVEIIEAKNGNSMDTFGAHTQNTDQKDQVSYVKAGYNDQPGNVYLRYIGKGSSFGK